MELFGLMSYEQKVAIIKELLCGIDDSKWGLNENGEVDVDSDVDLYMCKLNQFPFKFGRINGYFNCSHNKLTSLKGCPRHISDYFNASINDISTLEYFPEYIGGCVKLDNNKIEVIDGLPEIIHGDLDLSYNYIRKVKTMPHRIRGSLFFKGDYGHLNKGDMGNISELYEIFVNKARMTELVVDGIITNRNH